MLLEQLKKYLRISHGADNIYSPWNKLKKDCSSLVKVGSSNALFLHYCTLYLIS